MASRFYKVGGGIVTDTVGDIVCLHAYADSGGKRDVYKNAGASYQVAAGKTCYLARFIVAPAVGTAAGVLCVYGDNAITNTTTAVTNEVTMTHEMSGISTTPSLVFDIVVPIPAQKYPHILTNNGLAGCTANGIEI